MSDPLPPRAIQKLGKLAAPPQETVKVEPEPIGRMAVMKGLITADQLEEALRQQKDLQEKGSPLRIGQILLKRELITSEQFFELLESQDRSVRICPSCDHFYDISGHPKGVEVLCLRCGGKTQPPDSGEVRGADTHNTPYRISTETSIRARWHLGKYELKREIARGGMGIVLEAFDPELKRHVALKILREEDASALTIQRLHREAAIAAQLHHPNIVGVHEVGVVRDSTGQATHFIAMDYVQGCDLAQYLAKENPPREERIRIMEEISRAVAFAHGKGVVHRDLKPANVLIDKDGRVLLTDFGLARAESFLTQLTASQAVMGTPQYMAPEQVEGKTKEIDQRTDIYALGVMLYELLARTHPFPADTPAKLYEKILNDDPVRPTEVDNSIDRDLEVICLRAMEKSPARRYPRAEELAEDLKRFQKGDPILARPTTLFYRMGKKIARRKQILIPLGVMTLLGGILLGRLDVKEQQLTQQQELRITQMRETTDICLEGVLEMRRGGNLPGMTRFSSRVETICRDLIEQVAWLAEPHFHLGRIYRALMKFEEAREEQDRALEKNPDYREARLERGILHFRKYQERIALLRKEWFRRHAEAVGGKRGEAALAAPPATELEDAEAKKWKESASSDLKGVDNFTTKAILSWLKGDREEAAHLLSEAILREPDREEVYEWLGTLAVEAGDREKGLEWFTRGHKLDRGYTPLLEERGEIRAQKGLNLYWRGVDPLPSYRLAMDDIELLMKLEPGRVRHILHHALLSMNVGLALEKQRQDPTKVYQESLDNLSQVAEQGRATDEEEVEVWENLAAIRNQLAICKERNRIAAEEDFRQAEKEATRAITLDEENPASWETRAFIRVRLGVALLKKGKEGASYLDAALLDLNRSIELDPTGYSVWTRRAMTYRNLAVQANSIGEDSAPFLRLAVRDLTESIRLFPGYWTSWSLRAQIRLYLGQIALRANQDATDLLSGCIEDATEALELNGGEFDSLMIRGQAYRLQKEWGKALSDFSSLVRLAPESRPHVQPFITECQRHLKGEE